MKSSTSVESETQNDSNSAHSELRNLCSWLQESQTKELLEQLEAEASSLVNLVLTQIPNSTEANLLREQSIGESRGLRRLQAYVQARIEELQEAIK